MNNKSAEQGRNEAARDPYEAAGVDIAAGASFVERIKPLAQSTAQPGSGGGLGGFGALFDLKAAGYGDPILVATTDGVGTKVKIAGAMDKHDTIGIDLVAMCVNDLVVQGAAPLFFLDYFVTEKLDPERGTAVMEGVAAGCREAGCALIGGETAEHPGHFAPGDYDLAGFAVGAAERGGLITGEAVAPGDVVLGLAASGVHANGFSLVRRIVADGGHDLTAPAPFDERSRLGDALLTPTRIYVRAALAAAATGHVKALAHITAGGLAENVPRVLPAGCDVRLETEAWPRPPVFRWLQAAGGIAEADMIRTFNCGIGMAVIVAEEAADDITHLLSETGETVYRIGEIVPAEGKAS